MSEFTKGKWQVVHGAGTDEFDVISEDAPLHNHICVLFGYPTSRWDEQKANARLIAAAPEMYELLKEELIPTSDYGGTLSFSREAKLRELFTRIDGEEEQS